MFQYYVYARDYWDTLIEKYDYSDPYQE